MMDPVIYGDISAGIPHEKGTFSPLDMIEYRYPFHVIGFSWTEKGPVWTLLSMIGEGEVLRPEGEPFEVNLVEMEKVDLRLSSGRYCVGRFDGDEYIPCPYQAKVELFAQCPSCMMFDIPDPSCIFEPHCNRGTCGADFCQVEHVVYVTGFRNRFKVGMTQLRRVERRGMEQGADSITPIVHLGDRYSARMVEGLFSRLSGLPQAVSSGVKIGGWARPLRKDDMKTAIERLHSELVGNWGGMRHRLSSDVKVVTGPNEIDPEPRWLSYPLEEPLPSVPRRYKGEIVRGKVLGYKGNYMIFRSGGLRAFRIGVTPGSVVYLQENIVGQG